MQKAKLYIGWLIAAIVCIVIGIALLLVPEEMQPEVAIPQALQVTIEPEVTEEVEKYAINESSLPIIYVELDNDRSFISNIYTPANVTIINNFADGVVEYDGNAELKIRGNSTANRPKKPYKLKLEIKSDLFNMGASKHWVLLANDIDHTLIRNKLVCDFFGDIGGSYAPESLNAILMINGTYQGVYCLTEQIRIEEERVNIFDWEELAEDAAKIITKAEKEMQEMNDTEADAFKTALENTLVSDFSWISAPYTVEFEGKSYVLTDYVDIPDATGGFILEMDFYNANLPDGVSLKTAFQMPYYFSEPTLLHTNKELYQYAKDYIQCFEYAIHSDDYFFESDDTHYTGYGERFSYNSYIWRFKINTVNYDCEEHDGKHYTELFDLESLVTNFWVCEFSNNWDSMKNSTFITKDIGELAKIGPAWDYDWAFGNINMFFIDTYVTDEWHTSNEMFTREQYYQYENWNRYLAGDPYFMLKAYEKYEDIRPTIIEDMIKSGGTLDKYIKSLKADGLANDLRWSSTYYEYGGQNYLQSMNSLKTFIRQRISFFDSQMSTFDNFVDSLGYYERSSAIKVTNVKENSDGTYIITAETDNNKATKISFQVNGTYMYTATLSNGSATIEVPKNALTSDGSNIVVVRMLDNNDKYIVESFNSSEKGFHADHVDPLSNYYVFE